MANLTSEQRVTKSHISIMRSKEFCLLAWLLLRGRDWVDANAIIPTSVTNEWVIVVREDLIANRGTFTANTRQFKLTDKAYELIKERMYG